LIVVALFKLLIEIIRQEGYVDTAVKPVPNWSLPKATVERREETDSVAGSSGRGSIGRVLPGVSSNRYRYTAGIAVLTRDSRGHKIIGKDGGLFVDDGVPPAG